MTKRTGEQPQFNEDAQETKILPASSYRAAPGGIDSSTQPTQIISSGFYRAETRDSSQPTEVLSASETSATTINDATRILSYHTPPTVPPQHEGENTRNLRLANMRRTRPTTWAIIQHFFALASSITLLVVLLWFFLMTPTGQQLDENSFTEFSRQFINLQNQTSNLLDLVPAAAGVLAVIGLLFILLWKHRFMPALIGVAVALAANGTTQVLKNYLIVKPDYGVQEAVMTSAPSGHTTFAAAAGAALFLASPKKLRPVVALLGSLFALAAGFSTIINSWHRPVDVVSAIVITQIWTIVGLAILRFMRSEELDMSNTRNSGLILVPLLTIAGFFLGFCSLALYAVTVYDPISGGALMAGACMIFAVTAFTTSTQIALLRPQNKIRSAYTKVWTY